VVGAKCNPLSCVDTQKSGDPAKSTALNRSSRLPGNRYDVAQAHMKVFAICTRVLSTILVLLWPGIFFFSIFLFDAPRKGVAAMVRYVVVLVLWAYPASYLVATAKAQMRKAAGIPWWSSPMSFLFLLPFAHLLIAILAINLLLG
jgi:hypothetical protein